MTIGLLFLIFAATFAVVIVAVLVAGQVLENAASRAGEEFDGDVETGGALFKSEQLSSISVWHALLARFDFVKILGKHVTQAGLAWSAGRLTLSMLLSGAIAAAILLKLDWLPLWAMIGATWFTALAPYLYVLRRRSRRFLALAADFPDALDSMSRAMKAGHPIASALEVVARDTPVPLSTEFRKTSVEVSLGVTLSQALENLAERVPLVEVELFSAAVQLHSRTGGRLTDVLAVLAENMREQTALQSEVRATAAQGRATGLILTFLPVAIAAMMAAVSPMYIGVLLAHPYGKHMIAASVFCLVAAHFVMGRIVNIRI